MKLDIYKGFNKDFLVSIKEEPLIDLDLSIRLNVLKYDKKFKKKLGMELFNLDDEDHKWLLYEEFSFIERNILDLIDDDDLEVKIIRNNIYPEFYPIDLEINNNLYNEIISLYEDENLNNEKISEECKNFEKIYSNLYLSSSNHFYASYYNNEYDNRKITIENYFPTTAKIINSNEDGFVISSNISAKSYIDELEQIISKNIRVISFNEASGPISNLISNSLKAICTLNNIKLINYHEKVVVDEKQKKEIHRIAKNIIKIPNFKEFREIPFYKEPDISNEIVNISQEKIISEIITQAETAYSEKSTQYRDIFITASTGAGKSVMFQIPAVYLARKYGKLTIIIEPVKALMQDQKDQLNARGYNRVETFNSDLITQVEKEKVLNRIKNGEVDLLYLSPETLLSYSIETIIGDREIGLIIVDEAHIVTTWGFGFRPDYWYLGTYIYRLRHQIKTYKHKNQKTYKFPMSLS